MKLVLIANNDAVLRIPFAVHRNKIEPGYTFVSVIDFVQIMSVYWYVMVFVFVNILWFP